MCLDYMKSHLEEFRHSELFLSLDVESLTEVLSVLWGKVERKYSAISAYVDHDVSGRSDQIMRLLATVQWKRLSKEFLLQQISSDSTISGNQQSRQAFLCIFCF